MLDKVVTANPLHQFKFYCNEQVNKRKSLTKDKALYFISNNPACTMMNWMIKTDAIQPLCS